jgi:hypothetical protein
MCGRTLTLNFTNGLTGTMTIAFDSAGGGNYTYPPYSPGTVMSYSWTQDYFHGWLWPIYLSGGPPLTALLEFASNTSGTYSGTCYDTNPYEVDGHFSLTGP